MLNDILCFNGNVLHYQATDVLVMPWLHNPSLKIKGLFWYLLLSSRYLLILRRVESAKQLFSFNCRPLLTVEQLKNICIGDKHIHTRTFTPLCMPLPKVKIKRNKRFAAFLDSQSCGFESWISNLGRKINVIFSSKNELSYGILHLLWMHPLGLDL